MNKKQKRTLIRIIVSLVLFLGVFITDKIINLSTVLEIKYGFILPFGLYLLIYILIGYDVLSEAFRKIFKGSFLDETFLMTIATFGAFGLAIYNGLTGKEVEGFDEACAVLLFYQVGEFFQSYAVNKSRKSIAELMDIRPDYANLVSGEEVIEMDASDINIDDVILVNPGERIPLDGTIIKGQSSLDMKSLTGESVPKEVEIGSEVLSGSINLDSQVYVKVTKAFYDSTASKILELVESASENKSKSEEFISKFAKYYTPIVVTISFLLLLIPSLITGDWSLWIYRALSFLVVSCPCALVISIPLSFFCGLGAASKVGVLVKGSNYLELLSKVDTFVFDKTGTLTKGEFSVVSVSPSSNKDEILMLAATAESSSSHPIAYAILKENKTDILKGYSLTNEPGLGVKAFKGDDVILCGNEKMMKEYNISFDIANEFGTPVYVALNNKFVGYIIVRDTPKDEAKFVLAELSKTASTVMLTGDNDQTAKKIADSLGIKEYKASLLPQNKVSALEEIIKSKKGVVSFVGDGINDAPALVRSDVGISMGGIGSDAAIEASDVVLMNDDLKGIVKARKIARKTLKIVVQNIIFAIGIKFLILLLSALGITNMWIAILGDVGVAILAILNAMRVNYKKNDGKC